MTNAPIGGFLYPVFIFMYIAAVLLSAVMWPFFRLAGLRGVPAWLASRVMAPSLFAAFIMHALRWSGLSRGPGVFWIILPVFSLGAFFVYRKMPRLHLPEKRYILIVEAGCLIAAAILYLFFGYYYGGGALGERPLDLGLVSSLWGEGRFPPADFWFSGNPLNTYYLGSWTMAMLGRAVFLHPWQVYFSGLVLIWVQVMLACLLSVRLFHFRGKGAGAFSILVLLSGNAGFLFHMFRGISPFRKEAVIHLSRIIPHTINENPSVAFFVSELHAHVLALPLLIAWIVLVTETLKRKHYPLAVLTGIAAGLLAMTDSWLVLPGALAAVLILVFQKKGAALFGLKALPILAGAALVTSLAFLVDFRGYPFRLLRVTLSPTTFLHLLTLFGPLLLIHILGYPFRGEFGFMGRSGTALFVTSIILVILCELVYIDNNFPAPGERQNTVFRFHFAAWVFLALSFSAFRSFRYRNRKLKWIAWGIAVFFMLGGIVPGMARLLSMMAKGSFTTDARHALDLEQSGRLESSEWLFKNTSPGVVIVESAGNPYRGFGTVSSMSGRTALLGELDKLMNHGVKTEELEKRLSDLFRIYGNAPDARGLLEKYRAEYIVSGSKEKEAFPGYREDPLLQKYKTVFQSGDTRILKVE